MTTSRTERENPPEAFPLNNVAAWLRSAREERGETLDDVAGVTRIGKNYLEALEEGDLSRLPSQAYTRGFIRLYATHLGLSPETALAMLDASLAGPAAGSHETPAPPEHSRENPPKDRRRPLLIAVLAAVLALIGFVVLKTIPGTTPSRSSRIDAPPLQAVPPATTLPVQSPPQNSAPPQPAPPQERGDNQGIVLRLKAVSNGKITITIDGSFSQEYDLVTGDLVEWKAEDAIRLDLNNAASVEGELDGVKMAPFGETGRAAHLVVKADGIHRE